MQSYLFKFNYLAISRIIYTFARDFTIPEEYQQLIAYAHKCAKGHNHTRWYKSEENDPLQAMMLAGDYYFISGVRR